MKSRPGVQTLCARLFCLSQVLQRVEVTEKLRIKSSAEKTQVFDVKFHFLPAERYQEDKILTPHQILRFMETRSDVCRCGDAGFGFHGVKQNTEALYWLEFQHSHKNCNHLWWATVVTVHRWKWYILTISNRIFWKTTLIHKVNKIYFLYILCQIIDF